MTTFYAQPYSLDHTGFYFDSLDQYETGMDKLEKQGCEEVEIQFIAGDDHLARLAKDASIGQGQVHLWFEELDDLDEIAADQIGFLLDCGYSLEDALGAYEDVILYEGSAADYAAEMIEETTEIPENLRYYIDYDAIARDMELNGEITALRYHLLVVNAQDF
ncbi:MAG: antirestriction protein ArdA [Rhodospirillales bacterium]|nr:antirestriction protein ArdA [Rhodospirillales bacterium]